MVTEVINLISGNEVTVTARVTLFCGPDVYLCDTLVTKLFMKIYM